MPPTSPAEVAPATSLNARRDHLLPTSPALQPLFPEGALRRGSIVGVTGTGATSLTLALLAAPNATGAWCAAVGLGSLGLLAADGAGVDLSRFALVPDPGPDWPTIIAALLDAVEVVAVRPPGRPDRRAGRRLTARVRERRRALIVLTPQPASAGWSFDVALSGSVGVWEGLGWGSGHLRSRQLQVHAEGRRLAGRPRNTSVWLPGRDGPVASVRPVPAPTPLRRDGSSDARAGVA